jgi:Autographiviridae endonuclease VII
LKASTLQSRKWALQARFGLSVEEYEEMLRWQSHRCAICGRAQPKNPVYTDKSLAVDHDHKTGKIRGLLCMNCNMGIGRFKDDPELLMAACAYLLSGVH